jgi:hypothetical protein
VRRCSFTPDLRDLRQLALLMRQGFVRNVGFAVRNLTP